MFDYSMQFPFATLNILQQLKIYCMQNFFRLALSATSAGCMSLANEVNSIALRNYYFKVSSMAFNLKHKGECCREVYAPSLKLNYYKVYSVSRKLSLALKSHMYI